VLHEHYVKTTDVTYVAENRSAQPRALYVGLPVVDNAKVTGADGLEFGSEPAKPMALIRLVARQKLERVLKFEEGLTRTVTLGPISVEALREVSVKKGNSGRRPQSPVGSG
jgi:hypothetical protein